MVGCVEEFAHLWNRALNGDFNTLLQGHIRGGTALATANPLPLLSCQRNTLERDRRGDPP